MYTEELKYSKTPEPPAPSPELWARIARAHLARRARRQRLQMVGAASFAVALVAMVLAWPGGVPGTDWEARAQALELELHALPVRGIDGYNPAAVEAESRLMQLDRALQAAYDRGAGNSELTPLWKQRSELLSTLLAVRQENVAATQI